MELKQKQDQAINAMRKARNDKQGSIYGVRADGVVNKIYQLFGPSSYQYKKMRPEYGKEEGARLKKQKLKLLHEKAAEIIKAAETEVSDARVKLKHDTYLEQEGEQKDPAAEMIERDRYKYKISAMLTDEIKNFMSGRIEDKRINAWQLDIVGNVLQQRKETDYYETIRTIAHGHNLYEPEKNTEEYDLLDEADYNINMIKEHLAEGMIYEKAGNKQNSYNVDDLFPDTVSNIDEL